MAEQITILNAGPERRGWNWRAPAGIAAGYLFLHVFFLSPGPFWIDSSAYAHAIAHGREVIQPPGYLVFIEIVRILSGCFGHPYEVQQVITLAATISSVFILHFALNDVVGGLRATGFTAAYAFSWLALNLGSAGTTHALDFLFSSLWILLLVRRGHRPATPRWHLMFFLVLAAAGSIRLTSAIMAGPLVLLLLARDWRVWSFWGSALLAGAILIAVQIFTIMAYGGLEEFRAASSGSHAVNSPSSILFGGPWPNVAVNLFRASFWCFLLCPLLLLPLLRKRRAWPWKGDCKWAVLGCLAMVGGTAIVAFGYLCTHPGYLTPIFAPLLFLAATLPASDNLSRRVVTAQIILSLTLFFAVRPIEKTSSKWVAAANAFLLQYGAHSHRNAIPWHSLSGWLAITGNVDAIPPERREEALGELNATGKGHPDAAPEP